MAEQQSEGVENKRLMQGDKVYSTPMDVTLEVIGGVARLACRSAASRSLCRTAQTENAKKPLGRFLSSEMAIQVRDEVSALSRSHR